MSILIVSNGHGEDTIAMNLIHAIQKKNPHTAIMACPLVGEGTAYSNNQIKPILKNPTFPSGGFIRSIKDLIIDIKAGLINHIRSQIKTIKAIQDNTITIAVGDVFCLWLASFNKTPTFFLPTAKSDHFMPHSMIERYLIRKLAKHSFPRDKQTADSFIQHKLPASFFGNPMMDSLHTTKKIIENPNNLPIIGLLPGSRKEGYANLNYMIQLCEQCHKNNPQTIFACALPHTLDIQIIVQETQWAYDPQSKYLTSPNNSCHIYITPHFKELINQATCIIGLAGTANEQALHLGKTVICFEGFGPQSSLKRFKEQQQLMGNKLIICHHKIPKEILKILTLEIKKTTIISPSSSNINASKKIIDYMLKAV
ncbi:hypothetical protein CL658_01045 [bacterium]|nr:hypothetical protein [bacterium]